MPEIRWVDGFTGIGANCVIGERWTMFLTGSMSRKRWRVEFCLLDRSEGEFQADGLEAAKAEALRLVREAVKRLAEAVGEVPNA